MTDTTAHEPPRSDHIVDTRHLTKRFGGQTAVDDLTMQVREGTIFGFIGPSGSGKTTTVRLLTGVQSPTDGTAYVMGTEPTAFSERERERIGYMPQLSVLFPHLSIMENLRFVASIYGMPWGRRSQLKRVLEFVELVEHRRKRLRHASGGMQRRLALAAALVNEPQLLFLDEPTGGIDPVLRRKFWDHFESLRDGGRTLFVTTQYVGEAAYCDRIGVLREGRLLTVDTPEGLRRQAFGGEVIDLIVADRIEQDLITDATRLRYVVHAQRTRVDGRGMRITVDDADRVIPPLQRWFDERGVQVESIDRYLPPFDDVFVKLIESEGPTELSGLSDAAAEQAALEPEITIPPPPQDPSVVGGPPAAPPPETTDTAPPDEVVAPEVDAAATPPPGGGAPTTPPQQGDDEAADDRAPGRGGPAMRRIVRTSAFVRKEIVQVVRQPGLMLSLVLGPFVILLAFGSGLREEDPAVRTIFVVPEGSEVEGEVRQFAEAQSERLTVEGVQRDEEGALNRLRRGEVQMVLVFPDDAEQTVRSGAQAEVSVYHNQIDPLETQAIQLFTRTGVDEVNKQVLRELVRSGQQESADVQQRLDAAQASVAAFDRRLSSGADADQQLQIAQGDLADLALALGPSLAVLGGIEQTTGPGDSAELLDAYASLTESSDALSQSSSASAVEREQVSQLSQDLDALDSELETFQSLSPDVIVSPFDGTTQRIDGDDVQLVAFYAPAVLALLVQHIVVTFVGLSIVRERELGTNELFRAAPVTTAEMVIGKYLAFFLLGAMIAAALTAGLLFGLGVPMVGSWAVVVTTVALLLLASTGLGFLLALAAGSDSQAVQYAMLVLLASIFFSGFLLSLERFRPVLVWVARMLPVTSGVVLLRDAMLRGQLIQPLYLPLLAMLAVALFVASWRLFKRHLYAG